MKKGECREPIEAHTRNLMKVGNYIVKSNIQVLPIVASIGIGAAAYSMMTGRGGQLQNMIPLAGMGSQDMKSQSPQSTTNGQ
ncbi:hypothetical protein ACMYUM_29070 (plasmid) [Priestia megaterium]|uniref:hypothetical protein n=1 Tax=Priestia megaterium TaxID=1404 RepID=UPI0039EE5C4C